MRDGQGQNRIGGISCFGRKLLRFVHVGQSYLMSLEMLSLQSNGGLNLLTLFKPLEYLLPWRSRMA